MQRRPESKLALVGLISHPEQRMALVRDGATGKHARVKIGDTVNNWRVEQIESQRMRLKQGEWTLDLTLFTN